MRTAHRLIAFQFFWCFAENENGRAEIIARISHHSIRFPETALCHKIQTILNCSDLGFDKYEKKYNLFIVFNKVLIEADALGDGACIEVFIGQVDGSYLLIGYLEGSKAEITGADFSEISYIRAA